MGVFGFASSYDPNQQGGGSASSTIAQTVPGYSVADPSAGGGGYGAGGVNWNMSANNPLANWGNYLSGYDVNRHGGLQGKIDDMNGQGSRINANYSRLAYVNPLTGLFGKGGMVDLGDQTEAGQYIMPTWANMSINRDGNDLTGGLQPTLSNQASDAGMPVDARNLTFHNEAQIQYHNGNPVNAEMPYQTYGGQDPWSNQFGGNAQDPNSLMGLYGRMNNLSPQQLMMMSNNIGAAARAEDYTGGSHVLAPGTGTGIMGAFQQAQQNIKNDYANQDYAKSNPMSQGDSLNWLQASYNTLTNKLVNSYIL